MKNFILFIGIIVILFSFTTVFAEDCGIECAAELTGKNVCISGRITNIAESHPVTLLVGDMDNVLYIDQKATADDGTFVFNFELPGTLSPGTYNFKVGSDTGAEPFDGVLVYGMSDNTAEKQFFDGNIVVSVSSYIPTITGNISCIDGKEITFNVINSSDNTVIAQDKITSEDGIYNLNYALPSLVTGKDYTVEISCEEDETSLFNIDVEINSSIILVSVSGDVEIADDVKLAVRAKTSNSDLIDKSATFTADGAVAVTIPNLVANVSCDISMQGYETMPKKPAVDLFTKLEKFKIEWLYTATVGKFYSAGGNLYSYINNSELKLFEDIEAKFIVSHGDYVYFSNMRENGRIYRCDKDGGNLTLVSKDSGSWLYVKNGKLYYKDNSNNREEKYVNISAE